MAQPFPNRALAGSSLGSPLLILPVESNVRELDGRVLLAAAAAERGVQAILVRVEELWRLLPALPPAVVLLLNVIDPAHVERARAAGHVVAALDEEGLVHRRPEEYLRRRVSVEALRMVSCFFAWGEEHAALLAESAPSVADRVVVSGNPRFDLLRSELRGFYEGEAARLRIEYGRFVLVNSNFGAFNHHLGWSEIVRNWEENTWTGRDPALLERIHRYQGELFEEYVSMVRVLAPEVAPAKVIVRPHPTERHARWHRGLEDVDNVVVVHEGGVVPWLLASNLLIHNGCTTGVEGAVLGVPTFAFTPVTPPPDVEVPLPNAVSEQVSTVEQLMLEVKRIMSGSGEADAAKSPEAEGRRELLARHVTNLHGVLASDVMAARLAELAPPGEDQRSLLRADLEVRARQAIGRGRQLVGGIAGGSWWRERRLINYYRLVSPGIAASKVEDALRRLHQVTGRFGDVAARPGPGSDVVLVAPDRGSRR